jgi:class 3 adenylate cyclase/tetratricopeptide (TPR) repeat protein
MPTPDYPTGHVTLVFTDVEGSTAATSRLEEAHGPGHYERFVRDPQRERLFAAFLGRGGVEVQRAGDGHMFAFADPDAALAAAVAFQRSLADDPIVIEDDSGTFTARVRVGLHHTPTHRKPEVHRTDRGVLLEYPGADTNLAARIGALGAGGQVLLSEDAWKAAGSARGMGHHRWDNRYLKSFAGPHTVYEVLYLPGQKVREPGLRFFPAFYVGEINRYIPRPEKEAEVFDQFRRATGDGSTSRLVAIQADGGRGKTRLAVACAVKMVGLFDGHIHLIDLSAAAPPEGSERPGDDLRRAVAELIGEAVGLQGEAAQPPNLPAALARKPRMLLLLDNLEAVRCEEVHRLLAALATETPNVHLLVMSRTLGSVADVARWVDLDEGMTPDQARALFLARAALKKKAKFADEGQLSDAEKAHLDEILRLADRIPMIVENAAAWVGRVNLGDIARGLRDLHGKSAALPPGEARADSARAHGRHDSVSRSIAWSYDLLGRFDGPAAQRVFAACGLFADTFDAPDLAAVAGPVADAALDALVNASLAHLVEDDSGPSRYAMHRFTREFAAETLATLPDADDLRRRFVAHHVQLIEENVGGVQKQNDHACLARLERAWRNVIAAADQARALLDHPAVMQLSDVAEYLDFRGRWVESERLWLDAVQAAQASGDRRREGVYLNSLGVVYRHQGRWAEAIDAHDAALAICREFGDRLGEGRTLANLALLWEARGDREEARRWARLAVEAFADTQDTRSLELARAILARVSEPEGPGAMEGG